MPRYRLINEEGEDLGPFEALTSMVAGDRVYRDAIAEFEVVQVDDADDVDDVDGYLIVTDA